MVLTRKKNSSRKTRTMYGGQSSFEMGIACVIRHLLKYTTRGGAWQIDHRGFRYGDDEDTIPTANWIVNTIIHNYDSEITGVPIFGRRFDYSPEAVDFLEHILHKIKGQLDATRLDPFGRENGITTKKVFDKNVDNLIEIINKNKQELDMTSDVASTSASTQEIKKKEPTQKISDAVLLRLTDERVLKRTEELDKMHTADKNEISKLISRNTDLTQKILNLENENSKMKTRIKQITQSKIEKEQETEPDATEALKPDVTEESKPDVIEAPKPDITEESKPDVTEALKPDVIEDSKPELLMNIEKKKKKSKKKKSTAELNNELVIKPTGQFSLGDMSKLVDKEIVEKMKKTKNTNYTPDVLEIISRKTSIDINNLNLITNILQYADNINFTTYFLYIIGHLKLTTDEKIQEISESVTFNLSKKFSVSMIYTISEILKKNWLFNYNYEEDIDVIKHNHFYGGLNESENIIGLLIYRKTSPPDELAIIDKQITESAFRMQDTLTKISQTNFVKFSWYLCGINWLIQEKDIHPTVVDSYEQLKKNFVNVTRDDGSDVMEILKQILKQKRHDETLKQYINLVKSIRVLFDLLRDYPNFKFNEPNYKFVRNKDHTESLITLISSSEKIDKNLFDHSYPIHVMMIQTQNIKKVNLKILEELKQFVLDMKTHFGSNNSLGNISIIEKSIIVSERNCIKAIDNIYKTLLKITEFSETIPEIESEMKESLIRVKKNIETNGFHIDKTEDEGEGEDIGEGGGGGGGGGEGGGGDSLMSIFKKSGGRKTKVNARKRRTRKTRKTKEYRNKK